MNDTGNLCTTPLLVFEILTMVLGAIAWILLAIVVLRPREKTVSPKLIRRGRIDKNYMTLLMCPGNACEQLEVIVNAFFICYIIAFVVCMFLKIWRDRQRGFPVCVISNLCFNKLCHKRSSSKEGLCQTYAVLH